MRRLLVALLVVAGCHKAPGPSPKDADALWALAPEGTVLGVVVTPRGVAMLEHGWQDVHAFVQKAPELAPIAKQMDDQLKEVTGGVADIRLADYGLTSDKGGALFVLGPERVVLVVPLGDRDTFLAKAKGTKGTDADHLAKATCKTVKGAYICVSSDDLFGLIGKATTLRDKLEARGDVEAVAQGVPGMPMKYAAGVAQLERGQMVVRGTLAGLPAALVGKLGAPLKVDVDRGHTSGFGVFNVSALMSALPDVPFGNTSIGQLAKSIAGPMTIAVAAGPFTFDVKIPLVDPAPAQGLIDHCTDLVPADLGATLTNGACHFPLPLGQPPVDVWIDAKTLHLGMKGAPQGKAVPLTHAASELADGPWTFAFWGRGSALAVPALPVPAEAQQSPEFQLGVRAMSIINEMGIGVRVDGDKVSLLGVVRTVFSNPDDVVAKLATFSTTDLLAGKGPAFAQSLPASAPLAVDTQAGYGGLAIPALLLVAASSFAQNFGPSDGSQQIAVPPPDVPAQAPDEPAKPAP